MHEHRSRIVTGSSLPRSQEFGMTLAMTRPALDASPDDTVATTALAPTARSVDIDELVRTHLPLVGHLVREMLRRVPIQVRREDLTSAAMFALASSARSFDPDKGVPFAAYAALRIRGALTDELRSMDWASRGVRAKARELERIRATLTQRMGRTPSSAEVAQSMAISLKDLSTLASDVHRASVASLSTLSTDDSDALLHSHQDGPETLLLQREQLGYLRDAIAELPDRLRTVIEQYFLQQRRILDIAADLGVTDSRVSQLRSEALAMLRVAMTAANGENAVSEHPKGRRSAALNQFAESATTRSSLAGRLSATTLLADYLG